MTDEHKAILEAVRANIARLQGCPGPHKFEPRQKVLVPGQPVDRAQVCVGCGGLMQPDQVAFYLMGLKHGLSHGRADRPGDDPGVRLAGAPD